jgi:hypothetical protein
LACGREACKAREQFGLHLDRYDLSTATSGFRSRDARSTWEIKSA